MKTFPPLRSLTVVCGCCAVVVMALTAPVSGIPQNFSQSPFILRAGKPAEEFFRDPVAWAAGTAIPGEATETKSGQNSAVDAPGNVFGVSARALKLVRNASGELEEVLVNYDARSARLSSKNMHAQLKANIAAFLATKAADVQGNVRFAGREFVVTLPREPAPSLEVRITRTESFPAAKGTAQRH